MPTYDIHTDRDFRYIESGGGGPVLMLLHGLFGALSNFQGIISRFGDSYNVVVPMLPVYGLGLRNTGIGGLLDHVDACIVAVDELQAAVFRHQISLASRRPVNCQRWCG